MEELSTVFSLCLALSFSECVSERVRQTANSCQNSCLDVCVLFNAQRYLFTCFPFIFLWILNIYSSIENAYLCKCGI